MALLAAAGTAAVAGPVKTPVTGREASIPFAALGGIDDWRANGDRGLWIRGRSHRWYYAELLGSCSGLGFRDRIGFVIEPYGSFDRFSSIVVEGRICPIKSLRESEPTSFASCSDSSLRMTLIVSAPSTTCLQVTI